MKTFHFLAALLGLFVAPSSNAVDASQAPPPHDWLVDPSPFKAAVRMDDARHELSMGNGLVMRTIRLAPNAATIDYRNLASGEQLVRATGPEARVAFDGTEYAVGGLAGQPVMNYLKADWIDSLKEDPAAYRFKGWAERPIKPRFEWKKRPEWLARDYPWPAPGREIVLQFVPPVGVSSAALGKVVFEDSFAAKPDAGWRTTASSRHARSSFTNEGKAGEIYALPDTAVFAERPWPAGAVGLELTVDAGDDTASNAWGPGLAVGGSDWSHSFVIRPNQQCYDLDGQPQGVKFDRARPCHLRLTVEGKRALCEAWQDGQAPQRVGALEIPEAPHWLRVGKVGQGGRGQDSPGSGGDSLVRCHVSKVVLRAAAPAVAPAARTDLPEIDLHYAIYDGLPLIEKWLVVRNTTPKPVRVNRTLVETLRVPETESAVEPNIDWERPSLYVETDYAFLAMNAKSGNKQVVKWKPDTDYKTQVSYELKTPCLLEVEPEFGPDVDVAPGASLTSMRVFELFHDGTDRERRGLAQRRLYRVIAPWTQENPVMVHLISSDPAAIRKIVDQGAEVGVEMIILSFGSGMNLESPDPAYLARFKEVADYARSKQIAIGAYSLLASRGAANGADNCGGPGARVRYGVMPCLGSTWGRAYLDQLRTFLGGAGFGVLEHDGSYPGDTCAQTNHPGHRGLSDSQWVQFRAIADFYQWCRGQGIYLNVPDWYYLNGSSKCAMGYRETNWSLPRAEQEIIERQNIYDGTWEKTSSMGWMFVPLTQYHGGGAAATIEPLAQHLDHYEARLANLFGAGVQACYRGPRIYDTEETKAVVAKWIAFYKKHREVLDADMVHLRRPDGRDWDGFVHVNPSGREKALAFFYNPLAEPITRRIVVPLRYAGLAGKATMAVEGAAPGPVALDPAGAATIEVKIPARGRTWVLFD